ncbi:HPr kinase/phosphorylase [Sphingomonas sp.]|uniref:HPr kinase/phosphorylase n=1 Tax=Sphingomonas sp. TaxID=28214 RepID=UPI0035699A33
MHFYRVSGLAVRSEIPLPGLIPLAAVPNPDVSIQPIDVPDTLGNVITAGPTWQRNAQQFLLDIPTVGRFLLEEGRSIGFAVAAEADEQDVALFLAGNVFGILLHQRNHIVLHASAVVVNGRAILFCGASGAGKSTLAAALGERGYRLVTDDQAAITLDGEGVPIVHPDGRLLKLWAPSIAALDLESRKGAAMRGRLEKFYVTPGDASTAAMPVGAVYILEEALPPHPAGITRPNPVDGLLLLIANAYRPQLVRRMDQRPAYFRVGAALADTGGIFLLKRPMRFAAMAETIDGLEAHWGDIGLRSQPEHAGQHG